MIQNMASSTHTILMYFNLLYTILYHFYVHLITRFCSNLSYVTHTFHTSGSPENDPYPFFESYMAEFEALPLFLAYILQISLDSAVWVVLSSPLTILPFQLLFARFSLQTCPRVKRWYAFKASMLATACVKKKNHERMPQSLNRLWCMWPWPNWEPEMDSECCCWEAGRPPRQRFKVHLRSRTWGFVGLSDRSSSCHVSEMFGIWYVSQHGSIFVYGSHPTSPAFGWPKPHDLSWRRGKFLPHRKLLFHQGEVPRIKHPNPKVILHAESVCLQSGRVVRRCEHTQKVSSVGSAFISKRGCHICLLFPFLSIYLIGGSP